MKLIGATLGIHRDDTAGIAPVIGGQHATLYAKLTHAVRSGNRPVDRIELGVLQLISIYRDARAVDLPAAYRIRVAVVGDQVGGVSETLYVIAQRALALNRRSDLRQIQRVAVELGKFGDHFVVKHGRCTGLVRLQHRDRLHDRYRLLG